MKEFVPYSTYEAMNDTQLVELAQQKDNQALKVLFDKYKSALLKKACQDHGQYQSIDEQVFYDYYVLIFFSAIEKCVLTKGTFKGFLGKKLSTAKYEVLRQKYYRNVIDEYGNRQLKSEVFISLDTGWEQNNNIAEYEKHLLNELPDEKSEVDHNDDEAKTDLFEFLECRSKPDAKVAYLRSQGYGYEEIATMTGHTGNGAAKRNWTKRALERCQKYTRQFYQLHHLNLSLNTNKVEPEEDCA